MKKGLKRSFQNLANDILSKQSGQLLEPTQKTTKEEIRKELIESLRSRGWRSKYNTPYNRKKFYDQLTEEVFNLQRSVKKSKREIKRVNRLTKEWRVNQPKLQEIPEELELPEDWEETGFEFDNTFEWTRTFRILSANDPGYMWQVSFYWTEETFIGDAAYIKQNATLITKTAKESPSEYPAFRVYMNKKSKQFLLTFIQTDDV